MTDRGDPIGTTPPQARYRPQSETEPFLRGILASTVLLLIALALEQLFFTPGYYSSLVLHPFWIIVLLATLESGLFVGVATAALATLMMDWPPRAVGVDITAYFIDLAILPLQWLVAAICIGLFRQADIGRMAALQREAARLQEMSEALAAEVLRTDAALHEAELRVLTQRLDHGVPQDALWKLADLAHAPLDDLSEVFNAAAAGLSPLPVCLALAARAGTFEAATEPAGIGLSFPLSGTDPVVQAARSAGRAVVLPREGQALVVAGVTVGGVLAGVIVVAAPDEMTEAALPVADLLAGAVLLALRASYGTVAEAAE